MAGSVFGSFSSSEPSTTYGKKMRGILYVQLIDYGQQKFNKSEARLFTELILTVKTNPLDHKRAFNVVL